MSLKQSKPPELAPHRVVRRLLLLEEEEEEEEEEGTRSIFLLSFRVVLLCRSHGILGSRRR